MRWDSDYPQFQFKNVPHNKPRCKIGQVNLNLGLD